MTEAEQQACAAPQEVATAGPLVVPLMLYGDQYVRRGAVMGLIDKCVTRLDPLDPAQQEVRWLAEQIDNEIKHQDARAATDAAIAKSTAPPLKGSGIYGEQPNVPRPHPRDCKHPRGLLPVSGGEAVECPICLHAVGL